MCELVSIRKSSRKHRSYSQILFQLPVSKLKKQGDIMFCVAAPTLWNKLPTGIRYASFLENVKSVLKTHMFKAAFTNN